MARRAGKPLLALLVLSGLLLLPLVASVPLPRCLRLGSPQQHPPALKLTSSQEASMAAWNLGSRPAARMTVEVNDYQPSGPNNRHDPPKGPGRA
ncbi:hypothetical protein PAHAL_3G236000 [Panicum hallii]|uniref:Purple acid phosphatase Fn3-like domain-containing protein n=1 Tax=Panicum hallii TaxID=206008 RepID=A0A2S3HB10_9POAL|nr:uncharacterized protein LOC112884018 [Panicum hallii]PAN18921.1 hypothetical protein PAHAL_3G236000 [Panicum hallii]